MSEIHSCSYYCTRPECVRQQRDELRDKLMKQQAEPVQEPFALPCPTPKACREHCCSGHCIPRATSPQQAEPTRSQRLADAGFTRRPGLWALQARQALELIAAPQRPDGTWNRDREACRQLAAEALGRYEDE